MLVMSEDRVHPGPDDGFDPVRVRRGLLKRLGAYTSTFDKAVVEVAGICVSCFMCPVKS